jgi:SAM-dependent methyltransferase
VFKELQEINFRPAPFQFYTADELWANEHTSGQMLNYHLNSAIDLSSRNGRFIVQSVEWIHSHFGISGQTTVADFGCGPGLYTAQFAERGARVTGIDISKKSLKYAQEMAESNNLNIDYVHANYLDFETDQKFDLITMIMCDFCALSPEQRRVMLSIFHSLLEPDGSVLLDVYSLHSFSQKEESAIYELNQLNGFWSPEEYYCFVNSFKYDQEKVSLDKYTIIEKSRTRVVYNWLQYFDEVSLRKEFEDAGLKVENLYSDVAGKRYNPESAEFAIVATKC